MAQNGPPINFTRPEQSACLKAFEDPNGPDYKRALALIQIGADNLRRHPRCDMDRFEPSPAHRDQLQFLQDRRNIEQRNRRAIAAGAKLYDSPTNWTCLARIAVSRAAFVSGTSFSANTSGSPNLSGSPGEFACTPDRRTNLNPPSARPTPPARDHGSALSIGSPSTRPSRTPAFDPAVAAAQGRCASPSWTAAPRPAC